MSLWSVNQLPIGSNPQKIHNILLGRKTLSSLGLYVVPSAAKTTLRRKKILLCLSPPSIMSHEVLLRQPPPPPSPQRDAPVAGGASPASPSRGSALLSGTSSAVAGAIRLLSPPRIPPPSELSGASPFVESLVDSTLSTCADESISDEFGGGMQSTAAISCYQVAL